MEEEDLRALYLSTVTYRLLIHAGEGRVILCSCVPTGESTRLQWIVPNPWSHRQPWLNSVGQKPKDMNIGNGLTVRSMGWWTAREIRDGGMGKNNHAWNYQRTNLIVKSSNFKSYVTCLCSMMNGQISRVESRGGIWFQVLSLMLQ